MTIPTFVLIVLLLNLGGCGFTASGLKNREGYAEIHYPAFWEADKDFSMSIGPTSMRMMNWAMQEEDDEEAKLFMKCISGVRINTYRVSGDTANIIDRIDRTKAELNQHGWKEVITVNDGNERVAVLVKHDDTTIHGFVVLSVDNSEAAFINLIGEIDFEKLPKMSKGNWITNTVFAPTGLSHEPS